MLKNITIKNFQSLKNVELELEPFTVLVGNSDSGKSASFRAITTLFQNKRGTDFITYGQKLCTIEGEFDQGSLKLQRGKGSNDSFYEITPVGQDSVKFTKLGGSVPEEVETFLNIKDISIAGQHDKPYLLDTKEFGPSEVARILGSLTNVNVIFEGARESNRQKTQTAATLKIREADLISVDTKLDTIEDLEKREEALNQVSTEIKNAEGLQEAASGLSELILEITTAEGKSIAADEFISDIDFESDFEVIEGLLNQGRQLNTIVLEIETAQHKIDTASESILDKLVDFSDVDTLYESYSVISKFIEQIDKLQRKNTENEAVLVDLYDMIENIDNEYSETLRKAGKCPTCGQPTHKFTD